jgi:hypothetical protein
MPQFVCRLQALETGFLGRVTAECVANTRRVPVTNRSDKRAACASRSFGKCDEGMKPGNRAPWQDYQAPSCQGWFIRQSVAARPPDFRQGTAMALCLFPCPDRQLGER